jgi:exopolysaccharide biosynthesis protein
MRRAERPQTQPVGSFGPVISRRTVLKACGLGVLDVMLGASLAGVDYGLTYKTVRRLAATGTTTKVSSTDDAPWRAKFADKFTDSAVGDDTSYSDPDVSVTITRKSYDSGLVDTSGRHSRYGTKVSYALADVYISGPSRLTTVFAQDTYGIGYSESIGTMASRTGAVLAINGDSYSNNRHRANGTIIRNGVVYRQEPATDETCVLYRDGTMATYMPNELDPEKLVSDGAWQTWVFGPSLLDAGSARSEFYTWDYIRESHPRTAIGYFEPGHYCLLEVDGRSAASRGMFLDEMASLFESIGCQVAYNLDGGSCAAMMFQGRCANLRDRSGRQISDAIVVCGSDGQQNWLEARSGETADTSATDATTDGVIL